MDDPWAPSFFVKIELQQQIAVYQKQTCKSVVPSNEHIKRDEVTPACSPLFRSARTSWNTFVSPSVRKKDWITCIHLYKQVSWPHWTLKITSTAFQIIRNALGPWRPWTLSAHYLTPWGPFDIPLDPWDPVSLSLDPLGPCKPTPWPLRPYRPTPWPPLPTSSRGPI